MYTLLGLSLALAVLLGVNVLATLIGVGLWRALRRRLGRRSAATQAQTLLVLRLFPLAVAALFVFQLVVPAYLLHEPLETGEIVSGKLALVAALSVAGLAVALWRGLRSWLATRALLADWLGHAAPVQLAGVDLPAYRLRHAFPVIAVVGILRPRLFIAAHLFDELSAAELSAAIAHERGHLAARDNLKRASLRACRDVLTLVPLGRAGRALDRAWAEAAEAAADEHAAQTGGATLALDLASALVKIARLVPNGQMPTMPAGAFLIGAPDTGGGIASRVRRLVQLATMHHLAPRRRSLGFAFKLLCAVGLAALLCASSYTFSHPLLLSVTHEALEHVVAALK